MGYWQNTVRVITVGILHCLIVILMKIQRSATTLKPLTGDGNNIHHLIIPAQARI